MNNIKFLSSQNVISREILVGKAHPIVCWSPLTSSKLMSLKQRMTVTRIVSTRNPGSLPFPPREFPSQNQSSPQPRKCSFVQTVLQFSDQYWQALPDNMREIESKVSNSAQILISTLKILLTSSIKLGQLNGINVTCLFQSCQLSSSSFPSTKTSRQIRIVNLGDWLTDWLNWHCKNMPQPHSSNV